MIAAKTKKYQLDNKTYRQVGLRSIYRQQWWLPLSIFLGIILLNVLLNLVYPNIWIFFLALLAPLFHYLFWLVVFTGAPQQEQMKPWFEKVNYEINGKEIMMKINARQGMPIKWEMIKGAERNKDGFILYFSKAQFVYLPFKIFKSENDIQFVDAILRRKELLKPTQK